MPTRPAGAKPRTVSYTHLDVYKRQEVERHGDHEEENLPRAVDDARDDTAGVPIGLHVRQLLSLIHISALSRRGFLKAAALSGAGLAGATMLGGCAPATSSSNSSATSGGNQKRAQMVCVNTIVNCFVYCLCQVSDFVIIFPYF